MFQRVDVLIDASTYGVQERKLFFQSNIKICFELWHFAAFFGEEVKNKGSNFFKFYDFLEEIARKKDFSRFLKKRKETKE